MLYKHHLADQIRKGNKTQTRRISKIEYQEGSIQPIQENYKDKAKTHIKINKKYKQKLGDVTEQQAKAEGFQNLTEFKAEWVKITKHPWNPDQLVTAYEFELLKKEMF
jgi:N4-acetylcytidine amidohydrolase